VILYYCVSKPLGTVLPYLPPAAKHTPNPALAPTHPQTGHPTQKFSFNMSGTPVSHAQHPPHGHPDNTAPSTENVDRASTASHPPATKPDPTTAPDHGAQGGLAAAYASGPAELSHLKVNLRSALRQFPDFPSPGILFEDIMPIFANHAHFTSLMRALELQVATAFNTTVGEKSGIDVVVGLESRGFLFGPTLALRLGAGFVPVRKQGKLPGKCVTEGYEKEYGTDHFQVQEDAIKPGQKVIIVDDIIATGECLTFWEARRAAS